MTSLLSIGAILATGSLLTAFAARPLAETKLKIPRFCLGLVHGLISPFAVIVAAFGKTSVYSSANSESWYDLGFALGCAIVCNGVSSV